MKLEALDRVNDLRIELQRAYQVLAAFELTPGETVPVHAHSNIPLDCGRNFTVALLPVPKSQAISAARREVSKIVEQLAHLGVEVDEHPDAPPRPDGYRGLWPASKAEMSAIHESRAGQTVGGLTKGH